MTRVDTIWERIERWLAAEELELDDLEFKGSGRGQTVRVVVDGPGGVDLDRIAELSLGISRLLDDETGLEESYQLEVSSPGLERPLRRPRHFQKSIGREVSVKARAEGATVVVKGHLIAADDEVATIETADGSQRSVSYADVVSARTVFRWEKAPKPGKK
jgi:ribosome maturation factor RimP